MWRAAFEDETGGLFILEQIAASRRDQKQLISKTLEQLHRSGFQPVAPCLRASSGERLCFYDGFWWQITPFITGTSLSRPVYIQDARKGEALARVLGDLYRHAKKLSLDRNMPYFSLKQYILKIEQDMMRHDPDIGRRSAPIIDFLRRSFMDVHDTLPVAFAILIGVLIAGPVVVTAVLVRLVLAIAAGLRMLFALMRRALTPTPRPV